ncbi:unnamed protein product, partial [Laminaria digitata]
MIIQAATTTTKSAFAPPLPSCRRPPPMRRAVYAVSEGGGRHTTTAAAPAAPGGASFCWVTAGRRGRDSCLWAANGGGSRLSAFPGTERRVLGRLCALEVDRAQQAPGGTSFGTSSNPTSSVAGDHD